MALNTNTFPNLDADMFGGGFDWGAFMGGPAGAVLTSFGLPMLARLFGGGRNENAARRKWQRDLQYATSPQFMSDRMNAYTPMMNQLMAGQRGGLLTQANALQGQVNRNIAASGGKGGGIGALAATVPSSWLSGQFSDLATEGRRGAMNLASRDQQNFMRMLEMGPQWTDNRFLTAFGEGSDAFMGYLMDRNSTRRGY